MAVTLTSQPDQYTTAKPSCEWVLQMTNAGDVNTRYYAFYRLWQQGVGLIGEREIVEYTPRPLVIDYSDEILSRLVADLPDPTDTAAYPDGGLVGVFRIEYGEIRWDLTTGQRTVIQTSESDNRTVYRSSFQFYEDDWMNEGPQLAIFSNKPSNLTVAPDQADWVYFAVKNTLGGILTRFYDKDGLLLHDTGYDTYLPGTAVAYPIGPLNNPGSASVNIDDVYYYTVILRGFGDVRTIQFYIEGCYISEKDEVELYWQEAAGGYASIRMEKVDVGFTKTSSVYRQYASKRGTIAARAKTGGRRVGDLKGAGTFTLYRKFDQRSYQLKRYLQGIFGSRDVWVRMKDWQGNLIAARVLSADGEVTVSKDQEATEISISVELFKYFDNI